MTINYFGLIALVLMSYLLCISTKASSIDISAIQDLDISQIGDKKGFLEKKTNRLWLDIGEMPPDFLTVTANTRTNWHTTNFNGWRIAKESEVINLLMSIFPLSNLENIGGTWGGTSTDVPSFQKIAFTLGINDPIPNYGNSEIDEYVGWRANASFLGEDGKIKVFYLGRQTSDGYLPSVEILGFSDLALESYIEAFSVTPLFVAVNEPSTINLLLLALASLILKTSKRKITYELKKNTFLKKAGSGHCN